MSAKKRPADGASSANSPADQLEVAGDGGRASSGPDRGPQGAQPWGMTGGVVDRDAPWGVGEDSPLDEGSEPAAVPPPDLGEQRSPWSPSSGAHGFGSVEPSRIPEAGPGAPPDPAPARRPFPDQNSTEDLADNAFEEQTGMRPEGVARRE